MMRGVMRGVAASVAIFCLRAGAQETACAIGGTVLDSTTHKPVVRARVIAEVEASYSFMQLTDAAGSFCFARLTPATYRVVAQKAGYLETRAGGALAVEEGSAIQPLALLMTQQAGIAGVLLGADGDALPGAGVTISTRVHDQGGWRPDGAGSTETDGLGAFHFSHLEPGTYYLSAEPMDDPGERFIFPFLDSKGQVAREKEVETYYSGSFTFSGATPVEVKAGQQVSNLVLTLKKTRLRGITGKIANPPRAGFLVIECESETGCGPGGAMAIAKDGSFARLGLPPARYRLNLRDGQRVVARKQVDLTSGDAVGITLDPIETVDVTVTFRTEGKGPAYRPGWDFLETVNGSGEMSGLVESDGTYRFAGVPRDVYEVNIKPRGQELYVKRLVYGGEILADRKLDLRNGPAGVLEVTLSAGVAEVQGRAEGDGDGDVTAILVDGVRIAAQAETDQKGRFHMGRVAPGKYRLFAIAGFDEDEWGSADLVKALAGKSVEVELKESEKKQVRATAISEEEWDTALSKCCRQ